MSGSAKALLLFVLAFFFGANLVVYGYFEIKGGAPPAEMNGVKFSEYANFISSWKLVTVRFREDTKEMRYTYANEKAWKGLQLLKPVYEDGAVFAKLGVASEPDPAFPSSRLPSGSKRFQFMVRDKKKYKDTDGWGYALFSQDGKLFSDDLKITTQACAACHRMVPERGFVFSRLQFGSRVTPMRPQGLSYLKFAEKPRDMFKAAAAYLPESGGKTIESLEGDLKTHMFSGTLDEVVPLLIEHASVTEKTTVLYGDEKNFSLAVFDKNNRGCANEPQGKRYRIVVFFNGTRVRDAEHCQKN